MSLNDGRQLKNGHDQGKANRALREYQQTKKIPGEGRTVSDAQKVAQLNRDDFDRDLRPHEHAGENSGLASDHGDHDTRRAYDEKEMHALLPHLTSDQLKAIPILTAGTRLEQGATYLDLNEREVGDWKARGDYIVAEGERLVAKKEVDYELWNLLCEPHQQMEKIS